MRKFITALLLFMASASMWAYDVKADGIYYNLNISAKTAEVTSGDTKYSGSFNIPETIVTEGVTYSVIGIGDNSFYQGRVHLIFILFSTPAPLFNPISLFV